MIGFLAYGKTEMKKNSKRLTLIKHCLTKKKNKKKNIFYFITKKKEKTKKKINFLSAIYFLK